MGSSSGVDAVGHGLSIPEHIHCFLELLYRQYRAPLVSIDLQDYALMITEVYIYMSVYICVCYDHRVVSYSTIIHVYV